MIVSHPVREDLPPAVTLPPPGAEPQAAAAPLNTRLALPHNTTLTMTHNREEKDPLPVSM